MESKLKNYIKNYLIADIGLFLVFIGCAKLITEVLKIVIL